eukprot:8818244-Pyramimonas_sp.AAC.1
MVYTPKHDREHAQAGRTPMHSLRASTSLYSVSASDSLTAACTNRLYANSPSTLRRVAHVRSERGAQ